ncbi:MAG: MarR family winged helix-turn-helix transcriptional regulator [Microbacterium sp.]
MTTAPDPELLAHTGHLLRRAQQVHQAAWTAHVSTTVSSVQYAVLHVLSRTPGASQAHLGSALGLDRSTIADLVARMARRELLVRTASTTDRRQKSLALTALGERTLAELRPRVDAIEPIVTGDADPGDRAELHRLLLAIVDGA